MKKYMRGEVTYLLLLLLCSVLAGRRKKKRGGKLFLLSISLTFCAPPQMRMDRSTGQQPVALATALMTG